MATVRRKLTKTEQLKGDFMDESYQKASSIAQQGFFIRFRSKILSEECRVASNTKYSANWYAYDETEIQTVFHRNAG